MLTTISQFLTLYYSPIKLTIIGVSFKSRIFPTARGACSAGAYPSKGAAVHQSGAALADALAVHFSSKPGNSRFLLSAASTGKMSPRHKIYYPLGETAAAHVALFTNIAVDVFFVLQGDLLGNDGDWLSGYMMINRFSLKNNWFRLSV